jgi:hypothetical protein
MFIPSCPGYTGLTGALDQSDRCNPRWVFARVNIWVSLLLSCVGVVSSFGQFGGRLACLVLWRLSGCDRSDRCVSPAWPVWSHLVEVAKFPQQGPVWPVVLSGLTGVGQWIRGLVFRCVLGSEGCALVPRSSGTPVALWAWSTWVVSRRRVLEAVFILLEFLSPSRRIFIGSHSLPPIWFAVSVLQLRRPTRTTMPSTMYDANRRQRPSNTEAGRHHPNPYTSAPFGL